MAIETFTLNIPSALAHELESANEEFLLKVLRHGLQALKIENALEQYTRGGMSLSAAAHQAGISQSELSCHAYARGMEPPFSDETLAEELDVNCTE
jgi:hypothetical protein